MDSVTRLVAEDTSSDTITFEDEAFPLGTERARESFCGGSGEGVCLEMTHGTGLEVRVRLTQTLSARWLHDSMAVSLLRGKKECVYLSRQKGPNIRVDGIISSPSQNTYA